MKNYLKFIVAIVGITVAVFGSISIANAKLPIGGKDCVGTIGVCKVNTMTGAETPGRYVGE